MKDNLKKKVKSHSLRSYYRKSPTKDVKERKEEHAMRAIAQEQAKIYAIIKMKNKEKVAEEKGSTSKEELHKAYDSENSGCVSLR